MNVHCCAHLRQTLTGLFARRSTDDSEEKSGIERSSTAVNGSETRS